MIDKAVAWIKINAVLSFLEPGLTLDVGCGDRKYTNQIPNCVGVDKNEEFEGMLCNPDKVMDARELTFEDKSFKNVTYLDVLEHIPETNKVLYQAWRVLNDNGVLVIVDPNDGVLFFTRLVALRIGDAIRGNPDHIHKFSKKKLEEETVDLFKLEEVKRRGIFTAYKFRKVNT